MSLRGKHVLVTGGSRGIGRGIALKLAESGARVAVHYYVNEAAAKDTLERVRKHGADGFIVQADVSRVDDVRRMFAEVKQRFGTLDVFVANARPEAAKFYQKPMDITLEAWDHAMDSQAKAFLVGVRESAEQTGSPDVGRVRPLHHTQVDSCHGSSTGVPGGRPRILTGRLGDLRESAARAFLACGRTPGLRNST